MIRTLLFEKMIRLVKTPKLAIPSKITKNGGK